MEVIGEMEEAEDALDEEEANMSPGGWDNEDIFESPEDDNDDDDECEYQGVTYNREDIIHWFRYSGRTFYALVVWF